MTRLESPEICSFEGFFFAQIKLHRKWLARLTFCGRFSSRADTSACHLCPFFAAILSISAQKICSSANEVLSFPAQKWRLIIFIFLNVQRVPVEWRHRLYSPSKIAIFSRRKLPFSWRLRRSAVRRWRSVCTTKFPILQPAVIRLRVSEKGRRVPSQKSGLLCLGAFLVSRFNRFLSRPHELGQELPFLGGYCRFYPWNG